MKKKYVIQRSVWLRGEGSDESCLLRSRDCKRCCFGVVLGLAGTPDELLAGVGSPGAIHHKKHDFKLPEDLKWMMRPGLAGSTTELPGINSDECVLLMMDNDSEDIDDAERETRLMEGFRAQGTLVEFID